MRVTCVQLSNRDGIWLALDWRISRLRVCAILPDLVVIRLTIFGVEQSHVHVRPTQYPTREWPHEIMY